MSVASETTSDVHKAEILGQLKTYTNTILENPPCSADYSQQIKDYTHDCIQQISQPDFDPREQPTYFKPEDVTNRRDSTRQPHTYYVRCIRYAHKADLIDHLKQYVSRYPADYVHTANIASGFDIMDAILPEIGRSLATILQLRSDDIVKALRPLLSPLGLSKPDPSLCLLYGGYTSRDPLTRLSEDPQHCTRWSNYLKSAKSSNTATVEVYRIILPNGFETSGKECKRFREDLTVSEIERVVVDSIPVWRRLNSAAGRSDQNSPMMQTVQSTATTGGVREVWRPNVEEIGIRDALELQEASFLRLDQTKIGTGFSSQIAESVQHAYNRFGEQISEVALKETKMVRATYETYGDGASGIYAVSVSALKDNTVENLDGTVIDGLCGGVSAGQAFSSWRQQLAWVYNLDDDPTVPMSAPLFYFGAILDIWHVIWIHLGWGIFIRYFCSDLEIIRPLMVYSWSSLQAAFWSRFEGMAYLEETGSAPPNQMLSPADMNDIVGHVFIAKQGLQRYHLHICDYHVGVWKYVPILRPLYARVNFLVLLLRRLTKRVLQDGITRSESATDLTKTLPWFKNRLEMINSIAQEIGLTQALQSAKTELYEAARFYHTLRNRGSNKLTSEEFEPGQVTGDAQRKRDEQTTPTVQPSYPVESYNNMNLSGDVEEGRNIASWDYVLMGEPHSEERIVQIYDLQRYYTDRAERGMKNVDCYLIATHDRPVHKDGSLSDALSTWLLQLGPSAVPKWAANGHGRTQSGYEHAQQCRAAGTAAINSPAAMLSRLPDSLNTERQESCQIIDQFCTLLRSSKQFSLDNAQGLRGASCTGCHEIIIKAGHESQKHLCRASGSWIKVDTNMALTRFLCADELFEFFAKQSDVPPCMQDALARLRLQTQEEPLAAIFTRNRSRLVDGLDYLASRITVRFAIEATEEEKFTTAVYRSFGQIKHMSSHKNLETAEHYSLSELQGLATRITYMIKYFQGKNDFQHVWRSAKCPLCEFKVWTNSSQRTNTHLCGAGGKRTKYDTLRYHESLWDGLPPEISQRIWLALGSRHKLEGGLYVSQWNPTDASCWNTTTRTYKARAGGLRPVKGNSKMSEPT